MINPLSIFKDRKAAREAKRQAELAHLRNSPTLTFGSVTLVNPMYRGPNPYRGPEVTDPKNAQNVFIAIRNPKPTDSIMKPQLEPHHPLLRKRLSRKQSSQSSLDRSIDMLIGAMETMPLGGSERVQHVDAERRPHICNVKTPTQVEVVDPSNKIPRKGNFSQASYAQTPV